MSIKRYITNSSQYSSFFDLEDGSQIHLTFSGKDPITKERFIDVADPMIQKALETSPSFNSYFRISPEYVWTENEENEEKAKSVTLIKGQIEETKAPKKPKETPPVDTEISDLREIEIKNVTAAKLWLHEKHGVPIGQIGNSKAVEKKAKSLGFKITYLSE